MQKVEKDRCIPPKGWLKTSPEIRVIMEIQGAHPPKATPPKKSPALIFGLIKGNHGNAT